MDQRNIRILNILSIELALRKNQRVKSTIKISKRKTRLLARKIEVIHHQKNNYSILIKRIVSKIEQCTQQNRVHNILQMYVKWKEESKKKNELMEEVPSPPYEKIERHTTKDESQRKQQQFNTNCTDMEVVPVSDEGEDEYAPPPLAKPDMVEEVLITVTTSPCEKSVGV